MVIYTNEGTLDIYEGINYPFNYAIGDVRDITKRNIDFSKTIKIPATKNNNKFFEYFFNVNVQSGSFDINQKEFIRVEENGNIVFEGFLQLLSVTVNDGFSYYEAVVFSSFRNILDIVEGLDLNDLDFSEYNHPYEFETFQASILPTRKNFKYYSNGGVLQTTEIGYGYTYPYISYNGDIEDYEDGLNSYPNAYPAFFINEYLEKIFLLAGYKIDSKFFNTEYFKSLILPFTNGALGYTEEEIEQYKVNVVNSVEQPLSVATGAFIGGLIRENEFLDYDTELSDDKNQFLNNTITSLKSTDATFNISGDYVLSFDLSDNDSSLPIEDRAKYIIANTNLLFVRFHLMESSDGGLNYSSIIYHDELLDVANVPQNVLTYNVLMNVNHNFSDIPIEKDNLYKIQIEYTNGVLRRLPISAVSNITDAYKGYTINNSNQALKFTYTENSKIELGDDLAVSKSLPKFKITDFLKSIITMFNLYIYPKKDALNTLIIETRDEFYNGDKVHFFDSKLDKSKGYKISTLSEESAKTYLYKYKEGKDYINQDYDAANDGKKYAQKEVITDNQFLTNTQSYTTAFAASGNRFISNFNVPVFFDREGNAIDGYENKEVKLEPRILFYGGSGFAGSQDSLNYPTFSLDFETMKQTSSTDEWMPYFDLYSLFHKNTIEEVSSPNAKLLTCYLDLDVSEINIADKIYILGEYWRINKIIDYNANSNDTTKIELFKLKGNVNYLTAETVIEQAENNNSLFNDKFNNQFS